MTNSKLILSFFLLIFLGLVSCGGEKKEETKNIGISAYGPPSYSPEFDADKAYDWVKRQVDLGPRVPNTKAHRELAFILVDELKDLGWNVIEQDFENKAYDGTNLYLKNIIASYQPEAKKRIILAAHWDTRPFADKDPDKPMAPFDGANDGGSGVGVIMEIARAITKAEQKPNVGIDVIFFDGEDYGEPNDFEWDSNHPDRSKIWWCLGSQYWSKNKHVPGYSAFYGILLDMVGAKDAKFYREGLSVRFARSVVDKVWKQGEWAGFGSYFIQQDVVEITDDHQFVNRIAKIPMIDIIEYDPSSDFYFGPYHHTQKDNMDIISRETLKAVGQTVMNTLYSE
jgi:glutaminyl-peptide cyclotransferase